MGKVCGSKWAEKYRDYTYTLSHTSSTFKLMLTWIKDEDNDDESGGFS
jgi:hypothetical protein